MAMNQAHVSAHHEEHVDHQGNANLAVWLGLIAVTFMTGAFVATNVYLRGWNPEKYELKDKLLTDLPYYDVLLLIIAGIILAVAGVFFVKNQWRAFNLTLALATITFVAVFICQFSLTIWFASYNKQIATIYAPSQAIEMCLSLICVILLATSGWYASYGSKAKINAFFPVAMNVWMYTILAGIVILLVEDVMSVGQFAAWCGQHL
jgi:uncharacterized membrane protein YozB (DUF420 family)